MSFLRLSNATRKYVLDDEKERIALNNVSISFPETGLVAIVGKSGSGKSTIINLISLLDKPTSGSVYFKDDEINKWTQKKKDYFHNQNIGIIFQHYNLLENETVLFNVMLPMLIAGKTAKHAERDAIKLCESINFSPGLYHHKCKDLSGGEKERVAVLRALANDPPIILADEPTGALDSKNSLLIMDILKECSKTKLVIMVSHNNELVKQYADQIFTIKDGELASVKIVNKEENKNDISKKRFLKRKDDWVIKIMKSNFFRRFKRNIVSCVSLAIGLINSMLIIGFNLGSQDSIKQRSLQQFDYGVSLFYKETSQSISGSKMNLVQMSRPTLIEAQSVREYYSDFYLEPNADSLVPSFPIMKIGDDVIEELSYQPIYSYFGDSADTFLLIKGEYPKEDTLFQVVINKKAYDLLKKKTNSEPLGLRIKIHSDYEYHYYLGDELGTVITDVFIFDKEVEVVGVMDDFNFLSVPKIYYSFSSLKEQLNNSLLNNLSRHFGYDISWYEQLLNCPNSDALTSYSYRLFLKNHQDKAKIEELINNIPEPYKVESNAVTISSTLFDLISAACVGMDLFLAIALIGTALILGIVSFSSYSEDKKNSAILSCIGANKGEIFSIYLYENIAIGLMSLCLSLLISPLLSLLGNYLIFQFTSFANMITIPIKEFLGKKLLFPLIMLISTFFICIVSTYIPLFFAKKISLKEELADE